MVKKIFFISLISLLFNSVQMLGSELKESKEIGMEAKDWESETRGSEEKKPELAERASSPESKKEPSPQETTPWYESKWSGIPLGLGALSLWKWNPIVLVVGKRVGEIPKKLAMGSVGLGLILAGLGKAFAPFKTSKEKRFTGPWLKDYLDGTLSRLTGVAVTMIGLRVVSVAMMSLSRDITRVEQ